jgi:hypothetical protein
MLAKRLLKADVLGQEAVSWLLLLFIISYLLVFITGESTLLGTGTGLIVYFPGGVKSKRVTEWLAVTSVRGIVDI